MRKTRLCEYKNCGLNHHSKGYCRTHYSRYYRNGHTNLHQSKWTEEQLIIIAANYDTRGEFASNNKAAYVAATRMGVRHLICKHMPRLPKSPQPYIIKNLTNGQVFKSMRQAAKGLGVSKDVLFYRFKGRSIINFLGQKLRKST